MKIDQSVITGARRQKVIVEYDETSGPEWRAMFDNGSVEIFDTASAALKEIQKKAKRGNKSITITAIEWRNVPDGFVPPKGI